MDFKIFPPETYAHTAHRAREIPAAYHQLMDQPATADPAQCDELGTRALVVLENLSRAYDNMTDAYGQFEAAVNAAIAERPELGLLIAEKLRVGADA
jgi:hypothetical protein